MQRYVKISSSLRKSAAPALAALLCLAVSPPLAAQAGSEAPRAPRAMAGRPGPAEQFLARAGELGLSDQQVVRLAAIARRAEARRAALRARADSLAPMRRGVPGDVPRDSAARAARTAQMETMRAAMTREREQAEADLAAAIAILTPEQQARAWMSRAGADRRMNAPRGPRMDRGPRMAPRGPRMDRGPRMAPRGPRMDRAPRMAPRGRVGPPARQDRGDADAPSRPTRDDQRRRAIQPPNTSAR